jgi:hypothetical protein
MKFVSACEKHQIGLHALGELNVTAFLNLQLNDVELCCFLCPGGIRVKENTYLHQQSPIRQDWLVVHKNFTSETSIDL